MRIGYNRLRMPLRRLVADNRFLVAATLLPVAVAGLFLVSVAVPRFTVPPPASDLLMTVGAYDQSSPDVGVEFEVRDERVYVTLRRLPPNSYAARPTLWLFEHDTLNAQQIPVDLPDQLADGEPSRTIPVAALAGRRVVSQTQAPDGYELRARTGRGPGLIGDIFGMRRSEPALAIVKGGRVVPIVLPPPHAYQSPVFLGWISDDGAQ